MKSGNITINTDGISDEEKVTPKFQSAYRDMLAQLSAPGFADVLCAHEAAHAVYFTVAGMKQFEALPSQLRFDPVVGDYVGHLAAIQLLDLPPWTPGKFYEWFSRIACGHAAGGVMARKLMPSSDGGDSNDKDRFKKLCEELNKDPNVHLVWQDWWKQAQDAVAKDLEDPQKIALIQEEARRLRPQFGL